MPPSTTKRRQEAAEVPEVEAAEAEAEAEAADAEAEAREAAERIP